MHLTQNPAGRKPRALLFATARWAWLMDELFQLAEYYAMIGLLSPVRASTDRNLRTAAYLVDHAKWCGQVAMILDGQTRHLLPAVSR
jgi:hypothetical protein